MTPTIRSRLALLCLAVVGLAAGIGARLWNLQVDRCETIRAQAQRQHVGEVQTVPRRGTIVDRVGRELAVSVNAWSLFAHPQRVEDPRSAAEALAPVLGTSAGRILRRLRAEAPFVWLERRLDQDTADQVRRVLGPHGMGRAFDFEVEARRHYPHGRLGVHVVGFTDVDQRGIEGIERVFDDDLGGDSAGYIAFRDGRGGNVLTLVRPPSRRPRDVVLSLDLVLQHVVERELDRAVRETGARWASAVLLEPGSGNVLAMANRPTVDPSRYGRSPVPARRNRAVTDAYEPGSTFKILTAAAALDTGRVDPEQRFHCGNGSLVLGGRTIHDSRPHGWLSLRRIVEESSNVGIVRVAQSLPPESLYEYIRRFGFHERTGVEVPGESRGLLSPVSDWSSTSRASLAFGHEIAVTPLQMASAIATIANSGIRIPPRLVLGTRKPDGTFVPSADSGRRRVISAATCRELTRMLEGVVTRGTGTRAALAGYRIAGKTGTAQRPLPGGGYSDEEYVASFAGFGPVDSPRIAGLVVLDSPRGDVHSGGAVAAPVFRRILADALAYLRVPPEVGPRLAERRTGDRSAPATRRGTADTAVLPAGSTGTGW